MEARKVTGITALSAVALTCACDLFAATEATDYRTFKFSPETPYFFQDGKVDFGTYNGFRRYHAECHVCHGPAGLGSSYAPALMNSMKVLNFDQFVTVVIQGRKGADQRVMPSFATNMNVLPHVNDIYAYLKARADGVIGPARPANFPKLKTEDPVQAQASESPKP